MAERHVVLIPFPAQGHLNPFISLAKRLASQGVLVTLLNVESIHATVLEKWSSESGPKIRLQSIPFNWSVPFGMDASTATQVVAYLQSLERDIPAPLALLLQNMDPPVSLVISDYFFHSTHFVAQQLGIDRVAFLTGSAAWACLEYHVPQILSKGHLLTPDPANDHIDYVRGLEPFHHQDLPWYFRIPDPEWLQITIRRVPTLTDASSVLVNSFYQLEPQTFDFMRQELGPAFIPIGPVHLLENGQTGLSLRTEDHECLDWLDTQRENSVLYISFGSLVSISPANLKEICAALEVSKHKFIWVARSDLVQEHVQDNTYYRFFERLKGQGIFVTWAPQIKVLNHLSVGGFLSHCGWNSVMESICSGVPILCWPRGVEQNFNCKLVVDDWKVGLRMVTTKDEELQSETIEKLIRRLMDGQEGEEIRERAKGLCLQSKGAIKDQESNISQFLKHILRKDTCI